MENKYYVYLHRDLTGKVFYVGKGTGYRVKERGHRSKEWRNAAYGGFISQILKDNMSSADALLLEEKVIQIYDKTIVNKIKNSVVNELDFDFFNKYLRYSEESPSGLVWKIDNGGRGNCKFKAGAVAGSKTVMSETSGCWKVGLCNKTYLNHRVVWLLSNGTISSDKVVDHLNGDPYDNRIENLKIKTRADNARNRKYATQSTSVLGVCFCEYNTGQKYFVATWTEKCGKANRKKFSIKKYGEITAFELACETRKCEIERLRTLGLDYTDRHVSSQKK